LRVVSLSFLLFQPFVSCGHFAVIHKAMFGNVINPIGFGTFLAVGFLRSLDCRTRLGHTGRGVKRNAARLVPPKGNPVTIPVFKDVVSLKELVVPRIPLVVQGVVEDYGLWRLARFDSRLQ